jgi:hypothetical protein
MDAELLTKVLGPSTALSCNRLSTAYDDLHAIALLNHADLSEHGLTNGAIDKLSAVFEIAKRHGEREWDRRAQAAWRSIPARTRHRGPDGLVS